MEKENLKRRFGSVGGSYPEHRVQPGLLPSPRDIASLATAARLRRGGGGGGPAAARSSPTDLTIQTRLCVCVRVSVYVCVSRLAPRATLPNRALSSHNTHIIMSNYVLRRPGGFHIDTLTDCVVCVCTLCTGVVCCVDGRRTTDNNNDTICLIVARIRSKSSVTTSFPRITCF